MAAPVVVTRTHRLATAILAAGAAVAFALHLRAGRTFPVPWPDEIDFLTPAAQLARHGTLGVPQLSAPHGIFWISDAYYLVLAPVLRFAPATIDSGRWVSFVAILIAGVGFSNLGVRLGAPRAVSALMTACWLVSAPVVIAANITRHEAIVLAVVAWAAVATLSGRRVLAVSLAGWAVAMHPIGCFFALVLVGANLRRSQHRTTRWEWVAAGVLAAFLAGEALRFGLHADIAVEHLRFQLARKTGRATALPMPVAGGVLLGLSAGLLRVRHDPRRHLLFVASLGVAAFLANRAGGEMWYRVYSSATTPLLLGLAAAAAIAMFPLRNPRMVLSAATAAFSLLLLTGAGYAGGFFGMQLGADSQEWDVFVARVETELGHVAAATDSRKTVAISALSGLPWPAEHDHIGNLVIVKDTPITTAERPDFVLVARTLCCTGLGPATTGDVVVTIQSPHGVFDATLLRAR